MAADLNLSTRTLQRRLMDAGVAYQALLDATRHELACHYLASSAMPIAEVGYLLGYQDAPAFHHAFKQWQGQGPGQAPLQADGLALVDAEGLAVEQAEGLGVGGVLLLLLVVWMFSGGGYHI